MLGFIKRLARRIAQAAEVERCQIEDHVLVEIEDFLSKETKTLRRILFKDVRVIETFLSKEAHSGLLLFAAALIAMIWANSPWSDSYFDLWHTSATLSIGDHNMEMGLGHWVNDALMALFFLVVGLEIKRELVVGELSSLRHATFPIVGALGGMLIPALFYILINLQGDGQVKGFGIPMATDIAFALGCLMILGNRVPLSLKIFLTSLAVFDDLGAIVVIAIFYNASIDWAALGYAAIILATLVMVNRLGVKALWSYLVLGIVLWFWVRESGIHATIAGVLLAMTVPVRARLNSDRFLHICRHELKSFEKAGFSSETMLLNPKQQDSLEMLKHAYDAVQNPLVRLERALHPISAFLVMPLFALANAGVEISGIGDSPVNPVTLGIVAGLAFGKPLGIFGATYLADRLGWAQKPEGLPWRIILGGALLGGVGFTMSIFVTQLGLEADAIGAAKLFILASSLVMGTIGTVYLLRTVRCEQPSTPPGH
ncbi:MAG: Na+/H+ antiporter NhaA [Chloroflexi bacterium]|nr:Na+/H+ antiporter NhaA [Chloroflexota bacterium]